MGGVKLAAMGRPEVYFASSVSRSFDGRETIIEAAKHGADGVQLFVDPRYREAAFRKEVVQRLVGQDLGVIWHLPNQPTDEDLSVVYRLAQETGKDMALIHYLPATKLPKVEGVKIGWENSVNGFDIQHAEQVRERVISDGTFNVFDVLRLCYVSSGYTEDDILAYIRGRLIELPAGSYLHVADKKAWDLSFRDSECAVGDGVARGFVDLLRLFKGVIILEHERLDLAIETLSRLR